MKQASTGVARIVIVGAGSSSSTPMIRCAVSSEPCAQCADAIANPASRNHRLNPALLVQVRGPPEPKAAVADSGEAAGFRGGDARGSTLRNVLTDCGKTFRQQALKVLAPLKVARLDALLLTHDHADACYGLDDLREVASAVTPGETVQIYCDDRTRASMQRVFPYLFPRPPAPGGAAEEKPKTWIASVGWNALPPAAPLDLYGATVTPFLVEHGPGYLSNSFAWALDAAATNYLLYVSDVSAVPDAALAYMRSLPRVSTLVLDMLGPNHYPTHFSYAEAIAFAALFGAERTVFVGMSHNVDYDAFNAELAAGGHAQRMECGYDGMVLFEDAALLAEPTAETAAAPSNL
jgi:phosphoribosyl 1,2-cyclic phosphodiesterase